MNSKSTTTPTTTKKLTPKSKRAKGWSAADTNEEIADNTPPYGVAAFNFWYNVNDLPPMISEGINKLISNLAESFDLPDPNATRGEVVGFRRFLKLCDAAGAETEQGKGIIMTD